MMRGKCYSEKGEGRGLHIIRHVFAAVLIAVGFALVFGIFVQMLWNWLMPSLFNISRITYGQAFGLMILARLIFGSGGHHRRGPYGIPRGGHGLHHLAWHGCSKEDHGIEDWRQYDTWWNTEGREAFKKYVDRTASGREGSPS
jgi:hypothetical protein